MSSHPDPGNRTQYIAKEASMLQIAQVPPEATDFGRVKSTFAALPPAKSMAEIANAPRRAAVAVAKRPNQSARSGRRFRPRRRSSRRFRAASFRSGRALELEGAVVQQRSSSCPKTATGA